MAKTIEIHVPEYNLDAKPDYVGIGEKVDGEIEKNLPDGKYVYRAIGKDDHPKISLDDLAAIVLKTGTDRYDPERKEVCFEEFCGYDHDIHAGCFEIKNGKIILDESYEYASLFGDTVKKFYENTLLDRGHRVRIDLLIIYDANKLEKAEKTKSESEDVRPELKECLYKFKYPERKQDALVKIMKIRR